jgi:hypothetical protein
VEGRSKERSDCDGKSPLQLHVPTGNRDEREKRGKGEKKMKCYFLQVYDLKGSLRGRLIENPTADDVQLDENLLRST